MTSKAYLRTVALYDILLKKASPVTGEWEGYVTVAAKNAGIPHTSLGQITPILRATGAVEYLKRGSRYQASLIRLDHRPTESEVKEAWNQLYYKGGTRGRSDQRFRDLQAQIVELKQELQRHLENGHGE